MAIAGTGALGASIAADLAACQAGELSLLDFDFVDAGTVVRWHYGLDAAGPVKVLSLAAQFQSAYPYTRVRTTGCAIGAVPSPGATAPSEAEMLTCWLQGAQLVIDATAEHNVSFVISDLARRLPRVPQVYVWSIEGYPEFEDDVFVLELREPDGRPASPPRWTSHQLPPTSECSECG